MKLKSLVFLALVICLATPAFSQEIPDRIEIATIYEGYIDDVSEHSIRFPSGGTYVLYMGGDSPTDVEILLPGRRSFRHRAYQERNNFVILDVGRAGTGTITFAPAFDEINEEDGGFENFVGFMVIEGLPASPDETIVGDLSDSPLVGLGEGLYLEAFVFESPPRESAFDILATTQGFGFGMVLGNEVSYTVNPQYYREDLPEGTVVLEAGLNPSQNYVLIVSNEVMDDDSFNSAFEIEFVEREVVRVEPEALRYGTSQGATLTADLPRIGPRRALPFYLDVDAPTEVAIVMISDVFDTYLFIESPSGRVFSDDDSAYNANSLVVFSAEESGRYMVYASSYDGRAEGEFEIMVLDPAEADAYRDEGGLGGPYPGDPFVGPPVEELEDRTLGVGTISAGGEVDGRLTTDSSIRFGRYQEIYDLRLSGGQDVGVSVASVDFDTVLIVTTPAGEELYNDDHEGTDSFIGIADPEPGTYRIYVGSFGGGGFGDFTLSVTDFVPPPSAEDAPAEPLRSGRPAQGTIEADSPVYDGRQVAVYEFRADRGVTAVITHESDEMDAYLYVVAPDGQVYRDDDGAGDLNSRVVIDRTLGGTYRVYAGSFTGLAYGSFVLTLDFENQR